MDPLDVIEAATANGPATLGPQAPRSGRLQAGSDADVLIVDGDPLTDIALTADEMTAQARTVLDGFACTQHTTSNLLIEVSGDTATCRAHVVAYHQVPTAGVDFCVMRGYWEIGLARIRGRWAINRWTIVRTAPWEGDPDVYRIAVMSCAYGYPPGGGPCLQDRTGRAPGPPLGRPRLGSEALGDGPVRGSSAGHRRRLRHAPTASA